MNITKQKEYTDQLQDENIEQEKAFALATHLQLEPEEDDTLDTFLSQLVSTDDNPETFEVDRQEYMVLTYNEAEEKWEEALDNYLEECIYPELPDMARSYFDDKSWKYDAKMDGRGHALSTYDGNEYEETVNGTTFYIYRTN